MNIVVCIKQVPNVKDVKWDPETGSLIRKGVPSIINPNDRNAIEAALQIRERHGGEVTILSMGPSQVEEALREALAMGVDRAIQLTDKRFAGSDTWATSYTLGLAIKRLAHWDLIFTGVEALDGMTAQVGPQLAEHLNLPMLAYAIDIEVMENRVQVKQKLGEYFRTLETPLPALISVGRNMNEPRVAPMDAVMECFDKEIPVWRAEDLEGEDGRFGLNGSPTKLKKVFTPKLVKGNMELFEGSPEEVAHKLVGKLKEKYLI